MKEMIAILAILFVSALVAGCALPTSYRREVVLDLSDAKIAPNRFQSVSITNVAYCELRVLGSDGGTHTLKKQEHIAELCDMASSLVHKFSYGVGCGSIFHLTCYSTDGTCLATFGVSHGAGIYMNDPSGTSDLSFSSASRPLALKCFRILQTDAPHLLENLMQSSNPCIQQHIIPNYPFDELREKKASNKSIDGTSQ